MDYIQNRLDTKTTQIFINFMRGVGGMPFAASHHPPFGCDRALSSASHESTNNCLRHHSMSSPKARPRPPTGPSTMKPALTQNNMSPSIALLDNFHNPCCYTSSPRQPNGVSILAPAQPLAHHQPRKVDATMGAGSSHRPSPSADPGHLELKMPLIAGDHKNR